MLNIAHLALQKKIKVIAAGGKSYPCMVEADGAVSDDSKIITDRLEDMIPSPHYSRVAWPAVLLTTLSISIPRL